MSKPRRALTAFSAVAILILAAGCSQSPTGPAQLAPGDGSAAGFLYGGG